MIMSNCPIIRSILPHPLRCISSINSPNYKSEKYLINQSLFETKNSETHGINIFKFACGILRIPIDFKAFTVTRFDMSKNETLLQQTIALKINSRDQ